MNPMGQNFVKRIDPKGFTLIELLVIISIATLLSAIIINSLKSVRAKARDARRISDLREIGAALAFYYDDYGKYPAIGWNWSFSDSGGCNWIPGLSTYMSGCIPHDPVNSREFSGLGPWGGGKNYIYGYLFNGLTGDYDLVALLEDPPNPLRCEIKKWYFHNTLDGSSNLNQGQPWCPLWSNMLYSDH